MIAHNDIEKSKALLESDLETLFKLVNTFGTPVREGDVRAASGILRRWLVEDALGKLCRHMSAKPMFPVLDNSNALTLVKNDSRVNYFLTGGVMMTGKPVMFIYNSSAPPEEALQLQAANHIMMKMSHFLDQPRIYFNGRFISCREIITFTANKLGGVHLDFRRDEDQMLIESAADFMTFGGPLDKLGRRPPGELYLNIEPDSTEIMSGFHLEIIAASAAFIQVHLNGEPLVIIPPMKKTLRSRLFGNKQPRFRLYERE